MSEARELVVALAESMGLDDLLFNDKSVASIRFDDLLLFIHVDAYSDEIVLFLSIGEIPQTTEDKLAAYAYLLKTDNFGLHTGGGVLGVDDGETAAFFSRRFAAADLTVSQLGRIVEAFLIMSDSLIDGFTRTVVRNGGNAPFRSAGLPA